jgi:1-acyl-sn-glycerol-3-phosphate acyltransferase
LLFSWKELILPQYLDFVEIVISKDQMKRKICQFILKLIGWKVSLKITIPDKCILCVAPHTSNLDLSIGKLAFCSIGEEKPFFMIKKEWFRFPFNLLFKPLGGIPVDRGRKTSLIDQVVEEFSKKNCFRLAITPEGTRKANPNWKRGFYYISKAAQVPVLLAFIDYETKTVGIERVFHLSGNEENDIAEIKAYFARYKGKNPEGFAV